jgi:hypothetical protein
MLCVVLKSGGLRVQTLTYQTIRGLKGGTHGFQSHINVVCHGFTNQTMAAESCSIIGTSGAKETPVAICVQYKFSFQIWVLIRVTLFMLKKGIYLTAFLLMYETNSRCPCLRISILDYNYY